MLFGHDSVFDLGMEMFTVRTKNDPRANILNCLLSQLIATSRDDRAIDSNTCPVDKVDNNASYVSL